MLRIFPILFISIFFLIIYLNVEILTSKNPDIVIFPPEQKENFEDLDSKIDEKTDINLEESTILEDNNENLTSYTVDSKLIEGEKNQEIDEIVDLEPEKNATIEKKKESLPVQPKKKPDNLSNSNNDDKLKNIKKTNNSGSKGFFIQYGAFSKKINANQLKEKIEEKLKLKFTKFDLIIIESKKKGLFKVIFETDNEALAQEICIYSKKINISCLFQKR